MGIILAKTDYIISSKNTLINIKEFEESFSLEAEIIWHVRCLLMQNEEPSGFYAGTVYADVHKTDSGYTVYYNGLIMNIEVYEKQITDYVVYS